MNRIPASIGLLLLAACAENPVEPLLAADGELQVRPALVRTVTDATFMLSAVAFDSAGTPVFTGPVRWSSLDPQILAVDDSGTVRALSAGWGRVTARSAETSLTDTAVVAVGLRFSRISAANGGCGWMEDGTSWCWGDGAVGAGSVPTSATPSAVAGGLHFTGIAAGADHTCALTGGSVYCWGSLYHYGLGFTTCPPGIPQASGRCLAPGRVDLAGTWEHVAVGAMDFAPASCASGPSGTACWGDYRLARPEWTGCQYCGPRLLAATLTGPVALGLYHGCALDAGGRPFCWGNDQYGQLGAPIPAPYCSRPSCEWSTTPIAVVTSEHFVDLVAGANFNCGLNAAGQAFCWGNYHRFAESVEPPGMTPVTVAGDLRFRKLDAGTGHVCGLTADGAIWCWGDAAWTGALGEPVLEYGKVITGPRHIAPSLTFTDMAAGNATTCGITTGGSTVCIGSDSGLGQGNYYMLITSPLPLAPPGPLPDYIVIDR